MMQVERAVLNGLELCGVNAFFNVIQRLPRNMRLMYVHAYQSYVWNHMVSVRLTELDAMSIVEGDLVLKQGASLVLDDDDSEDTGAMRVMALEEKPDTTATSTSSNDSKETKEKKETPSSSPKMDHSLPASELKKILADRVHIVTGDDVKSGRYKITDLVLPLPGHAVTYPTNIMATRYKEFMAKDIDMENLDNPKVKDVYFCFSSYPSYK
jgi:tRNA pseudouridine13 synthase